MKYLSKIKKYIKKHAGEIIVIIAALLFVAGSSAFNVVGQSFSADLERQPDFIKWSSPDESANYIFSKLYAQEGQITLQENYNFLVDDIMRPRSFRSDHGTLKPVSFLGIILIYGNIASLFGYKIIPFLTPILAGLGIVFFYLLIKRIFGRNNAIISALILSFFPPFLYYSSRSMFHNVPFTAFLIIGFFFAFLMAKKRKILKKIKDIKQLNVWTPLISASLAGFFIGLAIICRTSELLWLLPLLLLLWIFNIRQIGFTRLILFLCFLFLALVPVFYYNQILYGSFFNGGYPQMNQSINTLARSSSELFSSTLTGHGSLIMDKLYTIRDTIFHFGFDYKASLLVYKNYFINMFSYIFWPAALGLVIFLQRWRDKKKKHWLYLCSYLLVSLALMFYYGSWEFYDNPDTKSITIGNSYTRYWLPIYLGAFPFVSLVIMRLSRVLCRLFRTKANKDRDQDKKNNKPHQELFNETSKPGICAIVSRSLVVLTLAFVSIRFVLIGSDEGLIDTAVRQRSAYREWEEVIKLSESNSVIITKYHDKLFFPERKVIVGLFDDKNMNDRYAKLAEYIPVYYYNFKLPDKDLEYLNSKRLYESGLQIELIEDINETFSLYKLKKDARIRMKGHKDTRNKDTNKSQIKN